MRNEKGFRREISLNGAKIQFTMRALKTTGGRKRFFPLSARVICDGRSQVISGSGVRKLYDALRRSKKHSSMDDLQSLLIEIEKKGFSITKKDEGDPTPLEPVTVSQLPARGREGASSNVEGQIIIRKLKKRKRRP